MSYSWQLQAANGSNNQVKRSDAIILPLTEAIDYARPSLVPGYRRGYSAPADIWNRKKGFLVQSTVPESYNLNFPTTGMHGLSFDLLISGVDVNKLTWQPVTHEGITATVTNVKAEPGWLARILFFDSNYRDELRQYWGQVVAHVTLTGPFATTNERGNPHPSPITVPRLPQTFELVGRDNDGHQVVYGFVLQKWFVDRGSYRSITVKPYSDQLAWCNSLGYRIPKVKDITNAKCGKHGYFPCKNGIDGAKPSSDKNEIQRQIGAGFFTEWGDMTQYPASEMSSLGGVCCWTSDWIEADGTTYYVVPWNGEIQAPTTGRDPNELSGVFCVTP